MLYVTCAIYPYTRNKRDLKHLFPENKAFSQQTKEQGFTFSAFMFPFPINFCLKAKSNTGILLIYLHFHLPRNPLHFLGTAPYLNFNFSSTSKSNFNNETNIKHNKFIHVTRFLLRCMPMASNLENDVKNQRLLIERRGFLFDKTL